MLCRGAAHLGELPSGQDFLGLSPGEVLDRSGGTQNPEETQQDQGEVNMKIWSINGILIYFLLYDSQNDQCIFIFIFTSLSRIISVIITNNVALLRADD